MHKKQPLQLSERGKTLSRCCMLNFPTRFRKDELAAAAGTAKPEELWSSVWEAKLAARKLGNRGSVTQ